MRRYSSEPYQFDRLFMSHLGSRLRPEYASLMRGPLPSRHWELLLDIEIAQAAAEPDEKRPSPAAEVVPHLLA